MNERRAPNPSLGPKMEGYPTKAQNIPLPQQVRNRLTRNMQSVGVRFQERVTDQSPS